MSKFPLGYTEDYREFSYPSHHQLIAAGPPTLDAADHLPFRKGEIWQDGAAMCVGAWLKRAVQLWCAMNGFETAPMVSGKCAYDLGRAQEYAGVDPDDVPPLDDIGSRPGLVLRGSQYIGLVSDDDYPDPTSPAWDPAKVNERPTPDALVKAYDARGLEFSEVIRDAWGFRESIRACMVRRQPVGVSLFVDSALFDNEGEVVVAINRRDPNGGGHMVGILDASHQQYAVLDNWWDYPERGIDWGTPPVNHYDLPRGVWRISWTLLETSIIQCLAVKGVPLIRKAAA